MDSLGISTAKDASFCYGSARWSHVPLPLVNGSFTRPQDELDTDSPRHGHGISPTTTTYAHGSRRYYSFGIMRMGRVENLSRDHDHGGKSANLGQNWCVSFFFFYDACPS